eukprot:PhM_4_TR5074/c0_g1_i1/m.40576
MSSTNDLFSDMPSSASSASAASSYPLPQSESRKAGLKEIIAAHLAQTKLGILLVNLRVAEPAEIFPKGIASEPKPELISMNDPNTIVAMKKRVAMTTTTTSPKKEEEEAAVVEEPKVVEHVEQKQNEPRPLHPLVQTVKDQLDHAESGIKKRVDVMTRSRVKYLDAKNVAVPCLAEEGAVFKCYQTAMEAAAPTSSSTTIPPPSAFIGCLPLVRDFERCANEVSSAFTEKYAGGGGGGGMEKTPATN